MSHPLHPLALRRQSAQTVEDGISCHKIDYVKQVFAIKNLKGYQNRIIGSKVTWLLDPRGAGLQESFQFPSVRTYERTSPFGLVVSYSANIPHTPNIFTDSGNPIK